MKLSELLLLLVSTGALSLWITGVVRRYALKAGMIDVPNQRSSHVVETPRGGGISIVLAFVLATIILLMMGVIPQSLGWPVLLGVVMIAGIGFWDDHGHVSAKQRIVVHFAAVVAVVFADLIYGGYSVSVTLLFKYLVLLVFCVWCLNLYNFMDGIDGIAVTEGVTVALGATAVMYISGNHAWAIWSLTLAVAIVGFGYWNWPPAKIFMGDAASGSIGFIFGVWVLLSTTHEILPFTTWLILLGVFLVDATVTLVTRVLTGQKWYQAHRSHAYQNLSRKWKSHLRVTMSVLAINVLWLIPLAYVSVVWPDLSVWICVIALSPLVFIALQMNAGKEEI